MASNGKAILVASFGTSQKNTRDCSIWTIEDDIAKAFPDWEVRRAFTSRMIIKRILKETGHKIDYVDEALQKLLVDGFKEVIVQPTHFIMGEEYNDIVEICDRFRYRFDSLKVSRPLLTEEDSYDTLLDAMDEEYFPYIRQQVGKDAEIVLMGHGTKHASNACYSQVLLKLLLRGMNDVTVVTVEGFPSFDDLPRLMEGKKGKVAIAPFMIVAGVHAVEDMAGDEEDSLKSILTGMGFDVVPVMKGMGEFPSIRRLFINFCRDCM